MPSSDRSFRMVFDGVADRYDRIRPGYPAGLYADLPGLGPGCRVLEIGCGTGQATRPLVEAGCDVVAVELGPQLAALAAANLPAARVEVGAFEDWVPPAEPFDLVLSATAWHWLDPAVRVAKAAAVLRPGGALAIVETHHVRGGSVEFFTAAQECYGEYFELSDEEFPIETSEVDSSGWFAPTELHRYHTDIGYTADEYRELILTYSPTWEMPEADRNRLLDCLTGLIHDRIVKRYLTVLRLARRLP